MAEWNKQVKKAFRHLSNADTVLGPQIEFELDLIQADEADELIGDLDNMKQWDLVYRRLNLLRGNELRGLEFETIKRELEEKLEKDEEN